MCTGGQDGAMLRFSVKRHALLAKAFSEPRFRLDLQGHSLWYWWRMNINSLHSSSRREASTASWWPYCSFLYPLISFIEQKALMHVHKHIVFFVFCYTTNDLFWWTSNGGGVRKNPFGKSLPFAITGLLIPLSSLFSSKLFFSLCLTTNPCISYLENFNVSHFS